MSPEADITAEEIIARGRIAGLDITPEDAAMMVAGVRRNQEMANIVRGIVEQDAVPAFNFDPRAARPEVH